MCDFFFLLKVNSKIFGGTRKYLAEHHVQRRAENLDKSVALVHRDRGFLVLSRRHLQSNERDVFLCFGKSPHACFKHWSITLNFDLSDSCSGFDYKPQNTIPNEVYICDFLINREIINYL